MVRRIRFRLLQARDADEPVRAEEHAAFAAQLGVDPSQVDTFDLLARPSSVAAWTDGVDAVLVGGSGRYGINDDAAWIPPFVDGLGELVDRQFPTFASCFGFQGIAVALGVDVLSDPKGGEVGTYDLELTEAGRADPLFSALPDQFTAQEGHKDRATGLPEGAVNLARSPRCAYQAFRLGDRVYATQFHPELTREGNLLRFERYLREYSDVFGAEQADRMRTEGFRPSPHADGLLARWRALMFH